MCQSFSRANNEKNDPLAEEGFFPTPQESFASVAVSFFEFFFPSLRRVFPSTTHVQEGLDRLFTFNSFPSPFHHEICQSLTVLKHDHD